MKTDRERTINSGESIKILIVDDEPGIVDLLSSAIENEKYECLSANSGEEALRKLEKNAVDIVITDIKMPEMDGLELLRKVKKRFPSIYVIMMTAYASVDSAVEAMKEGASDYIQKPVEPQDIRTTILGAVENIKIKDLKEKKSRIEGLKEEEGPFQAFTQLVREGKSGIYVARTKPDLSNIAEDLKEEIKFVALSKDSSPRKLEEIKESILDLTSEDKMSAIMIDDLDFLLNYYPFDKIEKLINTIGKKAVAGDNTLLLSGDPANLEEEQQDELKYWVSDIPVRLISESISNHIRRKIISELVEKEEASFTTLSKETGVKDSPKLSFHLRKLESSGLIRKDEEKRYSLTDSGKNAARAIENLREVQETGFGRVAWFPR